MALTFKDFCSNKTVQDLAQVTGRSEATIRAYKAGTPIPSDILIKIADYYKVTCDRVLGHAVPAEVAANPEGFPARPPLVHTISDEHKKLATDYKMLSNDHRQLRVDYELQSRALKAAKEANEKLTKQLLEPQQTKMVEDHPTFAEVNLLKDEIKRLQALLQSIHFLSEEKRGQ